MYIALAIIVIVYLLAVIVMRQPKFGKRPANERLERIKQSPNYSDGAFQNRSITPDLTDGANYFSIMKDFIFSKSKRSIPAVSIPSIKTNLHNLDINENILVWFGHSSYFMQVDGKRILVDPVLCGYAAPFSFSTKAFKGADIYKADDIPEIDFLFITHDHWDHLDHETVSALRSKVKTVVCSLGTGQHLEYWGYDKHIIMEMDWDEQIVLGDGFIADSVPARHFSGRGFKRNQAIWTSFVLQTPSVKLFLGGDSGYDSHFKEIGQRFGAFDLVILENGQYNKSWKHIHMMPGEVLQAAKDLNARKLLAVHNSKFSISLHAWDEPMLTITELNKAMHVPLIAPRIGEPVNLNDSAQVFEEWWKE